VPPHAFSNYFLLFLAMLICSRVFICIQEITQASYKFLYYLDQEIDRSHHHQVGKNSREKVKNKSGRELEYIVGGCQRVGVARRLCP
jgi:hypothetical protein